MTKKTAIDTIRQRAERYLESAKQAALQSVVDDSVTPEIQAGRVLRVKMDKAVYDELNIVIAYVEQIKEGTPYAAVAVD